MCSYDFYENYNPTDRDLCDRCGNKEDKMDKAFYMLDEAMVMLYDDSKELRLDDLDELLTTMYDLLDNNDGEFNRRGGFPRIQRKPKIEKYFEEAKQLMKLQLGAI